ncbi:hypothetical protein ON010_g4663 [Phytophthora cinnamomi]|nr:hypothetical protein ON010_g4663 [Phytophthora cinnamomi]
MRSNALAKGGSTAVVLRVPIVGPVDDVAPRDLKNVKALSDVRNTTDEAVEEKVGDYYGRYKPIYIGPDKNIIPEDITWMANRAADGGYPVPRAFIGSKSDASFVHKVYGVTSEGEAQPRYQRERLSSSGSRQSLMEAYLVAHNIQQKMSTVKMTMLIRPTHANYLCEASRQNLRYMPFVMTDEPAANNGIDLDDIAGRDDVGDHETVNCRILDDVTANGETLAKPASSTLAMMTITEIIDENAGSLVSDRKLNNATRRLEKECLRQRFSYGIKAVCFRHFPFALGGVMANARRNGHVNGRREDQARRGHWKGRVYRTAVPAVIQEGQSADPTPPTTLEPASTTTTPPPPLPTTPPPPPPSTPSRLEPPICAITRAHVEPPLMLPVPVEEPATLEGAPSTPEGDPSSLEAAPPVWEGPALAAPPVMETAQSTLGRAPPAHHHYQFPQLNDAPPSSPPVTPNAARHAVIPDSEPAGEVELNPEQTSEIDQRQYRYAYVMGTVMNEEGELRAIVPWNPAIQPLTSLSLADPCQIEREYAARPQILPRRELPIYLYEEILEAIRLEDGEIRDAERLQRERELRNGLRAP